MFLIMGISQAEKMLNFNQLTVCKCCGKYGRVEVFMNYTYFMLFFIPILKWNKQYFVKMNCCGSSCEISKELGKAIELGQVSEINLTELSFYAKENSVKHCEYCGFTTSEDFQFCPKCGRNI
ncbi:zinc ribbon domain-containing protein [Candidatus Galacturonibacter soehngenii]|uniref:Zinc ribbon domain-containing protein n=1 Tax=Candidatus Galacturonatibacter soehngenii TaxID=2307010 RepID=A0A7V7UCL4_9FIRM|nr:zinc ribbon domain-containing protein [Candidatus Galacturonibacter soehngenii]KAB1439597.1 zinc ribbon domain-containing protein [Candidatus Galacturonibacter soehngenii]MBA4687116.1 zinc ribbon domain-containing protein [Candidatus Galacturonibacter soehngenii]